MLRRLLSRKIGQRGLLQLACALGFILFQYHFFYRYDSSVSYSAEVFIEDTHDGMTRPYQRLAHAHPDGFSSTSFSDRCASYFDLLYNDDAMWRTSDFKELPYTRYIFETESKYINDRINEWKKENTAVNTDERAKQLQLHDLYRVEYEKKALETRATESKLVESATHLRVYGACYLDQFGHHNTELMDERDDKCHDIENRLFQWISRRMPTYTRWDGQHMTTMPIMSNYVDGQISKPEDIHTKPKLSACYMKTFRDSLNGRGIAISVADKYVDQVVSLFAVLRASNNTLPIQIVHSGDLSMDSQKLLIKVARTLDLDFKYADELENMLKARGFSIPHDGYVEPSEIEKFFPPLELWFVDVSDAVSPNYRSKFHSYANKLLAYVFSSFQHTVLIDTDTVPTADIDQHILQSPFYETHGAYFFKDRELYFQNKPSDVRFFNKLMPSKIDYAMFNIPPVSEHTLGNRFFKYKFMHFMESGLVAIDKRRHFTGVLASLQLQIWSPAAAIVWGDKELFWLGMSMAGDEDYYMNHWAAGSIGFVTAPENRLPGDADDSRRKKLISKEVCSTHPAHVSPVDNSTLLWYNGGYSFCKMPGEYNHDIKKNMMKHFQTADKLKKLYEGYHHMEAVIVPKHGEFYRKNDKGENERGWLKMSECKHFMYCAYDKVGGVDDPVSNGLLVEFDELTKTTYRFYGSLAEFAPEVFKVASA
ncbi:CYFA0S01e07954g1_1 [Cyberlindnera fabianii]|uniref:CYFA0S01e07954g1_1 n=1 Tax=Cyberlindnera fabianii TaxID=36022 RepID=A0A061AJ46_CYBFA|nr:hypothetical protein BON22_0486 [Cyberlindnera fabianii]CDR37153.1 CYFA0S01e07954g1_1 [Cyberlindnera fabianii]